MAPAAVAVVVAATAIAYLPALAGSFQLDDIPGIVNKVALGDLGRFARSYLLDGYWFLSLGRPTTELTFAIDQSLFGLSAPAFHRTGLALHLIGAVLAYVFARRVIVRAGWPGSGLPLFAAAVFALHPLQSQAVSYVSQRAEVLASVLYLAALLLLLDAERRALRWRGLAAWAAALAVFVLAIGAKVIAVTFPAAYLLVGACLPASETPPAVRHPWRRRFLLATPFVAFSAATAFRQMIALQGKPDAGFDIPGLPPWSYSLTQWRVLLGYLRLFAWPSGQNIEHDFSPSRGLLDPPSTVVAGFALALVAGGAVALVRLARGRSGPGPAAARLAGFGVLWFFLLLAPTSSVVPLADVMVEHRLYLASLGIALAAGAGASWAIQRLAGQRARLVAGAVAVVLLGTLAVALHGRNRIWGSSEALWADAVSKSPTKSRAHANYAYELGLAGKVPEAVSEYKNALRYASDGTVRRADVLGNLGPLLRKLGRTMEALEVLERALAEAPGDARIELELAISHLEAGDLSRARDLAGDAVRRRPQHSFSRNMLGVIMLRQDEVRGALEQFRMALAYQPSSTHAASNLAVAAERLGMAAEACEAWVRFSAIAPGPADRALARNRRAALGCR